MRSRNDIMRNNLRIQAFFLVLFFCYLVVMLYRVQIIKHEFYQEEATKKLISRKITPGRRGEIYGARGRLLVSNMPCQDVSITPCNISAADDARLAGILAGELELDYSEVLEKISRKSRLIKKDDGTTGSAPVKHAQIAVNVPMEKTRALRQKLQAEKLSRNVHFDDVFVRYYPQGKFLSNQLGLTVAGEGGTMGLEKRLDEDLRAGEGKEVYKRTPDGRKIGDKPLHQQHSHDGKNIYLTVEEPLQAIVEEELDKAFEKWRPFAAYAIMLDPKTGNVLAIAERPSFDPNDRKSLQGYIFRMRLIDEYFLPGSIMKPITVAGALEYGVITPDTKIDCTENGVWGEYKVIDHRGRGYGMQDVTGVIRKSSNIGTAKIAMLMGARCVYVNLYKFGLGSTTGLPLNGEKAGLVPHPTTWDKYTISRVSYGYSIDCTPVQLARAYCALANRGELPELRLIDHAVDPETGEVIEYPYGPKHRIFSKKNGEEVVKMMIAVTEPGGTATKAAIPGYHVAGKTGTAKKIRPGGGYFEQQRFVSFAGFVPAEDPAFVLLVTLDSPVYVDNPKREVFGGSVAGPVWKDIAERSLKYMNVEPYLPIESKKR